jgi:hypothetical protein
MEQHPFLADNLRCLEGRNSPVIPWLTGQPVDPARLSAGLVRNRFNGLDWAIDGGEPGRTLFGSLPPAVHYRDWVHPDKAGTSATIVVGANIGYGINHVIRHTPDTHRVLVVEPRPELLLACLGQTDYRPFIEIGKLHFLPPDERLLAEVVTNLDLQYAFGNIILRIDVPSQQLGPEYARWGIWIREKLENFGVEFNTLRLRQDTMVGNELRNFDRAMRDGSLLPLAGAGRGVAAVVLGAGPSLKTYAPLLAGLPEARDGAVWASALQTLPALRPHGLKPHFCLAIDFTRSMLQLYDRLDLEWAASIPLIYSTKMDPEVVDRYPGPTIPLWTLGGMATHVMQGREYVMDAGGNVGLTLYRLFNWLGAARIVLVGQDFGWTGDRTHADGHHAAAAPASQSVRLHQETPDAEGRTIHSSIQLLTAKRELEADIAASPVPTHNLYGGGAVVANARPTTLDEVLSGGLLDSAPGSRDTLLQSLERARRPAARPVFDPRTPAWAKRLREDAKRLDKLFKRVELHQQEIHDVLESVYTAARDDALCGPYLFNEIVDLTGLIRARHAHTLKDLGEFKRIAKRILTKTREVDRCLTPGPTAERKRAA